MTEGHPLRDRSAGAAGVGGKSRSLEAAGISPAQFSSNPSGVGGENSAAKFLLGLSAIEMVGGFWVLVLVGAAFFLKSGGLG